MQVAETLAQKRLSHNNNNNYSLSLSLSASPKSIYKTTSTTTTTTTSNRSTTTTRSYSPSFSSSSSSSSSSPLKPFTLSSSSSSSSTVDSSSSPSLKSNNNMVRPRNPNLRNRNESGGGGGGSLLCSKRTLCRLIIASCGIFAAIYISNLESNAISNASSSSSFSNRNNKIRSSYAASLDTSKKRLGEDNNEYYEEIGGVGVDGGSDIDDMAPRKFTEFQRAREDPNVPGKELGAYKLHAYDEFHGDGNEDEEDEEIPEHMMMEGLGDDDDDKNNEEDDVFRDENYYYDEEESTKRASSIDGGDDYDDLSTAPPPAAAGAAFGKLVDSAEDGENEGEDEEDVEAEKKKTLDDLETESSYLGESAEAAAAAAAAGAHSDGGHDHHDDDHPEGMESKAVASSESKAAPAQPRKIALLGERNTGTRWMSSLLEQCFPDVVVSPRLLRWKHWFQHDDGLKHTPTLVVAQFRNVYEWVEAMRKVPHHAPMHLYLDWKEFVTRPWTMPRPERDLPYKDSLGQVCYEKFKYHELISCVEGSRNDTNFYKEHDIQCNPDRDFSCHKPIYELRNDDSGEAYKSIIDMRADKIRNFVLDIKTWDWIVDVIPVRYEALLQDGTEFLISQVEDITGLKRVCDAPGKQDRKKRKLDKDMIIWLNEHVDWDAEQIVGYEKWEVAEEEEEEENDDDDESKSKDEGKNERKEDKNGGEKVKDDGDNKDDSSPATEWSESGDGKDEDEDEDKHHDNEDAKKDGSSGGGADDDYEEDHKVEKSKKSNHDDVEASKRER